MTELSNKPQIMGVMNITPDSFSDGGKFFSGSSMNLDRVVDEAAHMVNEGVHWLDIGGESTRPGAAPVTSEEELNRVIPVIEALSTRFQTAISVDTSQPSVIRQAAEAGASMVNDVRALQLHGALEAASESGMAVCLMHMQGDPESMQSRPSYDSVLDEVSAFLKERIDAALSIGIPSSSICIDPGFGFGKSLSHNLQLVHGLPKIKAMRYPVLVGFSRKSMIGVMTDRDVYGREAGTMMLNTIALQKGASIFRVHNVANAMDMLKIWRSLDNETKT